METPLDARTLVLEIAVAALAVLLLAWLEYLRHDAVAASRRHLLITWLFTAPPLLLFAVLVVRRVLSFI